MKLFPLRTRLSGSVLVMLLTLGTATVGSTVVSRRAVAQTSNAERSSTETTVPEKREEEKDENQAFRRSASVQKFAHMTGMEPDTAAEVFTALNFVVLLAGLGYLMKKTLPKAFHDRSTTIQKNLVDARTATEEANARLKAVEARLARLDDEIGGMRRQAEADAVREDQRMKAALEQETAKILAAAESDIQSATAQARRDLQRHAAELAIEQAAKRLEITADTDRLLVEGFAQRLAGDKGGQN